MQRVAIGDQAAGDTGNRCLDGHTSIHQGQGGSANRSLRGGAVGAHDFRNGTDCLLYTSTAPAAERADYCESILRFATVRQMPGALAFGQGQVAKRVAHLLKYLSLIHI